ncbi:AraC family transcriptional regulator [Cohnella fermenti]|nr:AraC family transcriptional regulator [Cohnella fermenti]
MDRLTWNRLNPVVSYANVLQCDPGFRFGPRRITNHQFIYVAAGRGTCRIGGREHKAEAGDLFYYGPEVVHRFDADEAEPFLLYGLHFNWTGSLSDADRAYDVIGVPNEQEESVQMNEAIVGERGMDELRITDRTIIHDETIPELFLAIAKTFRNDSEKSRLVSRGLLIQLFDRLHGNSRTEQASLSPHARTLFDVRDKLDGQAAKPYDRGWLSAWTGYNPDYLSRLFREQFGLAPHQYHLQRKLALAKELLEHTGMTAGAIAALLGFASPHYFNRLFRQHTGLTPLTFRQMSRMM